MFGELPIITLLVIRHGFYFSERKYAPGLTGSGELNLRRLTI